MLGRKPAVHLVIHLPVFDVVRLDATVGNAGATALGALVTVAVFHPGGSVARALLDIRKAGQISAVVCGVYRRVVGVLVKIFGRYVIIEPLEGVVHIDADHGLTAHRLRVRGKLVGAYVVVLISAPEIRLHGRTVLAHTVSPVIERGKAAARPANHRRRDVRPHLNRVLFHAAHGIRRRQRKIIAQKACVRVGQQRKCISALGRNGKACGYGSEIIADAVKRADRYGILYSPLFVYSHAHLARARYALDFTLERVSHACKAIFAILRKSPLGIRVVDNLHGVLPVAAARDDCNTHVGSGGFFNDKGGVVLDFLMPCRTGKGKPGVVLISRVVPVKHTPVSLAARGVVVFILQKVKPKLVDQAIRVKRLKAAVEKHLCSHALDLQAVAKLNKIGCELGADGRGVILRGCDKFKFHVRTPVIVIVFIISFLKQGVNNGTKIARISKKPLTL